MQYARSLTAIKQNEAELTGIRARDLALLRENRFRTPDAFVILSSAFTKLVEENNLKYKIDYILKHVNPKSPQSYVNAYTSVRKTIKSAQMSAQIEQELKELYEGLTAEGIGLEDGQPAVTRVILSPNVSLDPENNDTIIQNIQNWDEFMIAIREAWALAYHPNQLKPRMDAGFPEKNLRLAMIVQVMDIPVNCCHAYSCLPDVQDKLFLQTYYGNLDLREKITKDYYALAREGLQIISSDIKEQTNMLEIDENGELCLIPLITKSSQDRVIGRVLQEIARQTKKAERVLNEPVKLFFTMKNERVTLLWANRLGFALKHSSTVNEEYVELPAEPDSEEQEEILEDESSDSDEYIEIPVGISEPDSQREQAVREEPPAEAPAVETPEPAVQEDSVDSSEDDSSKIEISNSQENESIESSLRLATEIIERKYEEHFSGKDRLSRMVKRLNGKNVFERPIEGAFLGMANRFIHEEGFTMTPEEHQKALAEINYIINHA